MRLITVLTLMIIASAGIGQEKNSVLNRPLKNINYMSVNVRLGGGLAFTNVTNKTYWNGQPEFRYYFGLGYNFVLKNSWGIDLQINEEMGKLHFNHESGGSYFAYNCSSTGVELGIKKVIFKKRDDTFFVRAAFGYNFLVIGTAAGGDEYYYYAATSSSSNMYVFPEVGYQFRFPSGNHILDVSAGYKYGLTPMTAATMAFIDKGTTYEPGAAEYKGTLISLNLKYSFLFKGFEKTPPTDRKVKDHF